MRTIYILNIYYAVYFLYYKKDRYYFWMALFALGAVYSHNFSLASIGLLYLILFFYILKNIIKDIWKVILSGGSIIGLFVPWLVFAKKIKGVIVSDYNIGEVTWHDNCCQVFFITVLSDYLS